MTAFTGAPGTPGKDRARLVWRVADEPSQKTPTAIVEACSRCSQQVFVDRVITPDPPGERLALVCVPCALADPEGRDQVLRIWEAQAMTTADVLASIDPAGNPGALPVNGHEYNRHRKARQGRKSRLR